MTSAFEFTAEQEISQILMERPHLVILGAGASRAAMPSGDLAGRRLPLMRDFAEIVPVGPLLARAGLQDVPDFEAAYSTVAKDPDLQQLRRDLDTEVFNYFNALRLPPKPTIYDLLLLSLRPKDVIATFNWDPFLIQAVLRNKVLRGRIPTLLFLHGNVLAGYCEKDSMHGVRGARCSRCGAQLQRYPLLYPVADKDYLGVPAIGDAWKAVDHALKSTFMVTVFGYSAPQSDKAAMDLMRGAWGGSEKRSLEEFEIIDVREEAQLVASWDEFIHTHHYQVHSQFGTSWIAKHPRRTGEAYWNQNIEAKFIHGNPIPAMESLESLWAWFAPLLKVEAEHAARK